MNSLLGIAPNVKSAGLPAARRLRRSTDFSQPRLRGHSDSLHVNIRRPRN